MSRPVTVTDESICEALRTSGGVVTHAALAVGLTARGLSKRIRGNAEFVAARDEGRAEILDCGQTELFKAVRKGRPWAVRFVADTIGARSWLRGVNAY